MLCAALRPGGRSFSGKKRGKPPAVCDFFILFEVVKMTRREEAAARDLALAFVNSTIPEYITAYGRSIEAEGHLGKFTLRFENDVWTVESTVQGEDFEAYRAVVTINLAEQRVDSMCNCMESFNGPCRHVAATAIHFINSLDISEGKVATAPVQREDWRHSFRHFFGGSFEPEIGRHYFLFRFTAIRAPFCPVSSTSGVFTISILRSPILRVTFSSPTFTVNS